MNPLVIGKIRIGEGIPKIIVPLTEKEDEGLLTELERVKAVEPDLVEWRADMYGKAGDERAVLQMLSQLKGKAGETLLLFTYRTRGEGGRGDGSFPSYKRLLEEVIRSGKTDLVDIEMDTAGCAIDELVALAKGNGVFVVMSRHDFEKTPQKEEIIESLRRMEKMGADIPKIATMATGPEDVITMLEATWEMKSIHATRPFIAIAMGKAGIVSRLTAGIFGSAATFASGMNVSAPGQIPVSEMRTVLNLLHNQML